MTDSSPGLASDPLKLCGEALCPTQQEHSRRFQTSILIFITRFPHIVCPQAKLFSYPLRV